MRWRLGGVLAVALALPALRADDKPKADATSAKEQYAALVKDFTSQQQQVIAELQKTKGPEQQKLIEKYYGVSKEFAPKFLQLAADHPKDPVAADALFWVLSNGQRSPEFQKAADQVKALVADMPLRDLARRLNSLFAAPPALVEAAYQRVAKEEKDEAAADVLAWVATRSRGKTSQQAGQRLVEKFPEHRAIEQLCAALGRGGPDGVATLKKILETATKPRVKAAAALGLGTALADQADRLSDNLAEADKVAGEAEKYLVMVAEELSKDAPAMKTQAEQQLKALRSLRVGKPAPEIASKDLDQKEFKLSDYRGKVVLLDFWGHW